MTELPITKAKETSYENLVVDCPHCAREQIVNRMSDLKPTDGAGFGVAVCESDSCRKSFRITGDSANAAYEAIIFDCHELLAKKRYMSAILALAQSYEVFFSLYLRVELVYRPWARESKRDLAVVNRLCSSLEKQAGRLAFNEARKRFLQRVLNHGQVVSLDEAEALINKLGESCGVPSDSELEAILPSTTRGLVQQLRDTKINESRNRVVHHRAYRPTREEAEIALSETQQILFPLGRRLDLCEDLNWYFSASQAK